MQRMLPRSVLVTGASHKAGARAARALAAQGAAVVLSDAPGHPRVARTVAAIRRAGGLAISVPADLCQADQVQALFDVAEAAFGTPELIVHHAGPCVRDAADPRGAAQITGTLLVVQESARRLGPDGGTILNLDGGWTRDSGSPMQTLVQGYAPALAQRNIHIRSVRAHGWRALRYSPVIDTFIHNTAHPWPDPANSTPTPCWMPPSTCSGTRASKPLPRRTSARPWA